MRKRALRRRDFLAAVLSLGVFLLRQENLFAYRPFTTEDAYVLDKGHVQAELGHDYAGAGGGNRSFSGIYSLNAGVLNKTEINFGIPVSYYSRQETADFNEDGDLQTTHRIEHGFGDVQLLAKYGLVQETRRLPAFSPEGIIIFPTGNFEKGLGNPKTNYQALGVFSKTFKRFDIHSNLGWEFMGDAADEAIFRAGGAVSLASH